jgi:hypothetical protein
MNYIKDNWGLGLGVLFFLTIFIWIFSGSFVDLTRATRHTGRVESIFETRDNNKGSSTPRFKKLAIKVEGINQFLCYYKLTDNYKELQEKIKTGDIITVYYKPTKEDYNLNLYQITKADSILLDKSSFESNERLASIWALIIGVGGLSYAIYKRVRSRTDREKKIKERFKKVRA